MSSKHSGGSQDSFEWAYWSNGAFTVLLFGCLVWGWFRAITACLRILRLCLPKRKKKKKRCKRNWRNREKEFRRRKLPYHLVRRCSRRVGQRPPRLDGSRFPSPRCTKHRRWRRREERRRRHQAQEEEQFAREKQMREYIEFCELPRPKPVHVDAPVWEPLLNWFCSDDFSAYGRVSADPIVANDELASRLKQFIDQEDLEVNVNRLLARAAEYKANGLEQKRISRKKKTKSRSMLRPSATFLRVGSHCFNVCHTSCKLFRICNEDVMNVQSG